MNKKCYGDRTQLRWPEGVISVANDSKHVVKRGFDETQSYRQRLSMPLICHGLTTGGDTISPFGHLSTLQSHGFFFCLYWRVGISRRTKSLPGTQPEQ